MKKENNAVKYGLIGAVILVALGIISQFLVLSYLKKAINVPENFSFGKFILISICSLLVIIGVFIFCIVKAIKDYKKINPEYTYRKLVVQGLLVTLLLALVSTGVSYLYNTVITPETKEKTIELSKQLYQSLPNIPDDQREKMIEKLDNQNPAMQLLTALGLTLIFGMIISLISASVLNKRNILNNPNHMR